MFSRPTGEIEKNLQRLPRMTTSMMIERIRTVTNINEKLFDIADKERYNNTITEFTFFAKKVLP